MIVIFQIFTAGGAEEGNENGEHFHAFEWFFDNFRRTNYPTFCVRFPAAHTPAQLMLSPQRLNRMLLKSKTVDDGVIRENSLMPEENWLPPKHFDDFIILIFKLLELLKCAFSGFACNTHKNVFYFIPKMHYWAHRFGKQIERNWTNEKC